MRDRLRYVDIAKGIGIVLVILGHRNVSVNVKMWIYSFHMPFFFLLTGYLFEYERYTIHSLIKSKVYSLLVPFCYFSLLGVCVDIIMSKLFGGVIFDFNIIIDALYIRGTSRPNTFLWFLIVLFEAELLLLIILKFTKKNRFLDSIVILFLFMIGYTLKEKKMCFGINVTCVAIVFVYLGMMIKEKWSKILNTNGLFTFFIWLGCLFITCIIGLKYNNTVIDMYKAYYGNYLLFVLTGVFGSVSLLCFAIVIEKTVKNKYTKLIEYWGTYSIIILSTQFFVFLLFAAFDHLVLKCGTSYVSNGRAFMDTLITLMLETSIIYIIVKYLPFFIGKKQHG